MHTYPEVMFKATNFTTSSQNCMADKAPIERHLDFNSASNLYADAEEVSTSHSPFSEVPVVHHDGKSNAYNCSVSKPAS